MSKDRPHWEDVVEDEVVGIAPRLAQQHVNAGKWSFDEWRSAVTDLVYLAEQRVALRALDWPRGSILHLQRIDGPRHRTGDEPAPADPEPLWPTRFRL